MKRPLRSVPWFKPAPEFHRPSRRVRPIRVPAIWEWNADTMADRWQALCHRSRSWRAVNDIGIGLLLMGGLLAVLYMLFAEGAK